MNYIIAPSNDDILHYAKGSETKTHKYISRVMKGGKWVYTYTKNRLRGNKVTNKDAKKGGKTSAGNDYTTKLQYSPTIKTDEKGVRREPAKTETFLRDTRTRASVNEREGIPPKYNDDTLLKNAQAPITTATRGTPYSPQNRAVNTASRGTPYAPPHKTHYTPSIQTSPAFINRSPHGTVYRNVLYTENNYHTGKSKFIDGPHAYEIVETAAKGTPYTPKNITTTKTSKGTSYTPSSVKSTKTTERAPMSVMGYSHVNVGGGSHSFDKDFTDISYEYGKSVFDKTIEKLSNASKEKERKKEEKKRKVLSNKNKEPEKILGGYSSSGQKKRALYLSKGSHKF